MPRERKEATVLSVRLSGEESRALKELVVREGGRMSDIIRSALCTYVANQKGTAIEWKMPVSSRLVVYTGVGEPQSRSLNPHPKLKTLRIKQQEVTGTATV